MRAYVAGDMQDKINTADSLGRKYDREMSKLGPKGFKEKYGVSYRKARDMLLEGTDGDKANTYREKYGKTAEGTAAMYDKFAEEAAKRQGKAKGGMAVKKYAKGGYANCGASVPPNGKSRK
jgi:hypothetical protein